MRTSVIGEPHFDLRRSNPNVVRFEIGEDLVNLINLKLNSNFKSQVFSDPKGQVLKLAASKSSFERLSTTISDKKTKASDAEKKLAILINEALKKSKTGFNRISIEIWGSIPKDSVKSRTASEHLAQTTA